MTAPVQAPRSVAAPVLLADPRVTSIAVTECGEPLVSLLDARSVLVSPHAPAPPLGLRATAGDAEHAQVRATLADRLEEAAASLPRGIRLRVVEGYRPPAAQRAYFEAYRAQLLRDDPRLTRETSGERASRFVAPPGVAAHPSGAAVDVTLVDRSGRPLDMGTAIDATPEESAGACFFDSPLVDAPARARRVLLAEAMTAAGFVNYPTEWWHWSFGDRYWAFVTGAPSAVYGPVATAADRSSPGA